MTGKKAWLRVVAFLVLAAAVCLYADFYLPSQESPPETAGKPLGTEGSFAAQYSLQFIADASDDWYILRLCLTSAREYAGHKSGTQTEVPAEKSPNNTICGSAANHGALPATASAKGRPSPLAFSLGGNSPPAYHA